MDQQYKKYQGTLVEELESIEKSFVEERTELIDAVIFFNYVKNSKELELLFETRRANES